MIIKRIEGNSEEVLVLIHGGNSTSEEWNKYIPLFSKYYTLYLVTISSHGEDYNNPYTSIFDNAKDIYDKLTKMNVNSICVYGRGLGSQIALSLIEQYPDFVKKVVFESLSCMPLGFYRHLMRIGSIRSYKNNEEDIANHKILTKKEFKKMVKDNVNFCISLKAANYKNKALIMYAHFDDDFIKKSAEQLCNFIKDAEVKEVDGLHNFGLEKVDEVSSLVLDFLER